MNLPRNHYQRLRVYPADLEVSFNCSFKLFVGCGLSVSCHGIMLLAMAENGANSETIERHERMCEALLGRFEFMLLRDFASMDDSVVVDLSLLEICSLIDLLHFHHAADGLDQLRQVFEMVKERGDIPEHMEFEDTRIREWLISAENALFELVDDVCAKLGEPEGKPEEKKEDKKARPRPNPLQVFEERQGSARMPWERGH